MCQVKRLYLGTLRLAIGNGIIKPVAAGRRRSRQEPPASIKQIIRVKKKHFFREKKNIFFSDKQNIKHLSKSARKYLAYIVKGVTVHICVLPIINFVDFTTITFPLLLDDMTMLIRRVSN